MLRDYYSCIAVWYSTTICEMIVVVDHSQNSEAQRKNTTFEH